MPVLLPQASRFFYSCDGLWEGRHGTAYSADGNREYTVPFLVQVKRKEMGPTAVCTCPGLPLPGSIYVTPFEYDLFARLTKLEAAQRDKDDWQAWIVTATYSTRPNDRQQTTTPDNPEDEPVEVDTDFEVDQYALQHDLDGKAFINSAYMPFSPAPTFPIACPILNITRNELDYSIERATFFAFSLNSKTFLGYPPKCVQCLPPKAKQMYRGLLTYAKVSYRLKFAPKIPVIDDDGNVLTQFKEFQPRFLDQGLAEYVVQKNPVIGPPLEDGWVDIYTSTHQRVTQPVLLNGKGRKAKPNAQGVIVPKFRQFRIYEEVDFSLLLSRGLGSFGLVQTRPLLGGGLHP